MAVKSEGVTRGPAGSYFRLVRDFPLVHIRDREHLAQAQATIDRLLCRDLDDGEEAYLDVLTDLVDAYEEEHVTIPDAPEADVLRELMAANRLSQPALAGAVGIAQSTLSAVLNRKRALTRSQVTALAGFFRVSPAVFFPA
jgi:HTH-type transcriptional regulator/antitoxin HigA